MFRNHNTTHLRPTRPLNVVPETRHRPVSPYMVQVTKKDPHAILKQKYLRKGNADCSVPFFIVYMSVPFSNPSAQILLFELEFYGPINTFKVMSSRSVYLTTLLLGRLSPLNS